MVAVGFLGVPHFQGLLGVQVERDRDGWKDADVPEGMEVKNSLGTASTRKTKTPNSARLLSSGQDRLPPVE